MTLLRGHWQTLGQLSNHPDCPPRPTHL